jgi:hypothetical protein
LLVVVVGRRPRRRRARQDDQLHRFRDVVRRHRVPAVERGRRHGDARGKELAAVALHAAARGLAREALDLLVANRHLFQILARKQDLRLERLGRVVHAGLDGRRRVLKLERGRDGAHAVVEFGRHVGRQRDRDAVQQVLPQRAFLGVEGGDEQGAARVADGEAFALDDVPAVGDDGEEQVGDGFVQ